VQNTLTDALLGTAGRGWPLRDVMQTIEKAGQGVIVFLRQAETPRDMMTKIESIIRDDIHHDEDQLADLGVRKMSLLSAPKKFHGLAGFGLEVAEYYSD
jgi:3,4-dihydroxy 2-butanone 4-phosphate synthase/GTP cyclohydrolase II